MSGRILIDAHYGDETRVAILDEGGRLENFEIEHSDRRPIKGNIYLAKIVRIEPSIQAAFIDYGAEKHGFLPLSEIRYEYFNRHALRSIRREKVEQTEDEEEKRVKSPQSGLRHLKIQEVISTKQVVLVQAEKEVRGNKCAFFTTFISLPGRYCVLVPNSPKNRRAGVSKRLEATEKIRLKEIVESLDIPEGMGCIVRTAGENCNKQEIKRDLDYLFRLWNEIKEKTTSTNAPALIYEEGNVVKRSIRDLYRRTMGGITIQGVEAYKEARTFMKLFTPSHVKKINLYEDDQIPLFQKYDLEEKLKEILDPVVPLPSGGSIIIGVTEALTAIDVNSGKSKSERDINGTAVKTNLEAATEIARQLKLRDIAGIIVIDFIDMMDHSSINKVEHRMREVTKQDHSNIQIGKISQFGLLELSRQRLRVSLSDSSFTKCKHCAGTGKILSDEVIALSIIRKIESFLSDGKSKSISVEVAGGVDLFILNQKRKIITEIEERYKISLEILRNQSIEPAECQIVVKEFKREQQDSAHQEEDTVIQIRKKQRAMLQRKQQKIEGPQEEPIIEVADMVADENYRKEEQPNRENGILQKTESIDHELKGEPVISEDDSVIKIEKKKRNRRFRRKRVIEAVSNTSDQHPNSSDPHTIDSDPVVIAVPIERTAPISLGGDEANGVKKPPRRRKRKAPGGEVEKTAPSDNPDSQPPAHRGI